MTWELGNEKNFSKLPELWSGTNFPEAAEFVRGLPALVPIEQWELRSRSGSMPSPVL
jgi:hypothetical protein